MEPEVGAFLARIAKSISLILLWMLINTYFGVRKELFFLEGKITSGHMIFYAWFILSGILLFWFIVRLWKYAPVYDPKENMWYQKLRKGEKMEEE
jgi:hypothetical protein